MENKRIMMAAEQADKVLNAIQRVLLGCTMAFVILSAVMTLSNLIIPGSAIANSVCKLEIGTLTMMVAPEYALSGGGTLAMLWLNIALACTGALGILFSIRFLRKILVPIQKGEDFHEAAAKNLKYVAWIILAMGILRNGIKVGSTYASIYFWKLEEVLQSSAVQSVKGRLDLEFGFLFVFVGVLLASSIIGAWVPAEEPAVTAKKRR